MGTAALDVNMGALIRGDDEDVVKLGNGSDAGDPSGNISDGTGDLAEAEAASPLSPITMFVIVCSHLVMSIGRSTEVSLLSK